MDDQNGKKNVRYIYLKEILSIWVTQDILDMVMFIKLFVFISFYTIILQQDDIFHFPSRNLVFISEVHFLQISIYLYINKYSSKHVMLIKKWINSTPTCHASWTIMDKIKSPNKQFIAISILNFIFALPFLFRFERKKPLLAAWFEKIQKPVEFHQIQTLNLLILHVPLNLNH